MASSVVATQKKEVQTSAGEVLAGVFWDSEEYFWDFLERGTTVISEIKDVKQPIRRFRPNTKMN